MANLSAKVVAGSVFYVNTDKGPFVTTLWTIDQPLVVGDYVSIDGIGDQRIWNAYQFPTSVFASNGRTYTAFTTPNGHFKAYVSDSNLKVELYNSNGVLLTYDTIGSVASDRCAVLNYLFIMGSNNVPILVGFTTLEKTTTENYRVKSFSPNSANSFGYYSITEITHEWGRFIATFRVDQSDIDKGQAMLDLRYVPPTDPYGGGGETAEGGGDGDFDDTTEPIDIPTVPTISSADSKFITIYNPSLSQLNALANYMWSSSFDIALYKTLFANPMDCILGLSIVPVAVPNSGASTVTVGNMPTTVSMNKATSQYVDVSCGSVSINEYWGGYLDYEPYTKIELYLPYIGTHPISADDVMGKSVEVTYRVDILSGACAAYIKCGGSVLYQFIGQCASSIPITGNDWTNVINGVLSIAGSIGSMVATGGAAAPMAVAGVASTAVNALKPNIEKSGSMSGTGGLLGVQKPYFIITRPRQAIPAHQNAFIGYPSFVNVSLDSIGGYNEIESVHLENIPCTGEELAEIERILKEGVIFSGV